MSVDYKWANAVMDQLKGCQAENARLRDEAAAMTTAIQKVEHLESEVASLRMTLQCIELAGEQRRVSGGKSPVEVKSSFISAKTLTVVLEALRSNWFFATDDDEGNNEEVIAATKMLEAEIATQNNAAPTAGDGGSHPEGERVRASAAFIGNSLEPCAYAIFENREPRTLTFLREHVEAWMTANVNCTVIPLYRSPTLTDAEREAVDTAAEKLATPTPTWQQNVVSTDAEGVRLASILRGLLERMK